MILDEVMPIHQALSLFQGGLSITLGSEDEGLLERLQGIIRSHKGDRPCSSKSPVATATRAACAPT